MITSCHKTVVEDRITLLRQVRQYVVDFLRVAACAGSRFHEPIIIVVAIQSRAAVGYAIGIVIAKAVDRDVIMGFASFMVNMRRKTREHILQDLILQTPFLYI